MHQGWPKFTANLWYATEGGGLAALVYAPCTVTATVAGDVKVRIREITEYPFRERVIFRIEFPDKGGAGTTFPLRLRIPSWSDGATVSVNGVKQELAPGRTSVLSIQRKWKNGDAVVLDFRAPLQTEEWYGRAWTFVRGPLVYALKMEENWAWKPLESYFGDGAWEVTSASPWNYCIMRDSFRVEDCQLSVPKNLPAYPWTLEDAPITLTVPARTLPSWQALNGSPGDIAFWTEDGQDYGESALIELIPYGCTTLRIASFPTRIVPWDLSYKQ